MKEAWLVTEVWRLTGEVWLIEVWRLMAEVWLIAQDWRLMAKAWRLMVEVDGKWLFLLSRSGRVSWGAHLPFCASRLGCKPFSALRSCDIGR